MKSKLIKKITLIVISLFFIAILFSNNVFAADSDESVYTIEDIIFNKVPILDINVFSETAGGQIVNTDSVVYVIRDVVAKWYVSIRNLVIIALALGIVYTGIRIAVSTIPARKAKYKQMIIGWFKSLIIVLTIHYLMIIIISLNSTIVETIQDAETNIMTQGGWEEETIYDTIRTRAYEVRANVSFPAMIMYITLVIIWIRFLWVYIKRMFTTVILIVVAPFIGAKYAIDSASGKKGSSFTSWIYDFTMNVLLQSVHALIYTALISSALELSLESIVGFIIALVFFNFMLKADEIFRNIFSFDRSKLIGETAKQEKFADVIKGFAGITFVGQMATGAYGLVTGTASAVSKQGKQIYKKMSPEIKEKINEKLNDVDMRMQDLFDRETDNPILDDFNKMMYNNFKIRRLSRADGSLGIKARQLKSKLSRQRKARYKSNYKFIKDKVTGVGSVILAVPMTVINPIAGVGLLKKGITNINKDKKKNVDINKKDYKGRFIRGYRSLGIYKLYYGQKKARAKYEKKRNKIYTAIKEIDDIDDNENKIRDTFDKLRKESNINENETNRFKDITTKLILETNTEKISNIINEYVSRNNIESIDNSTINDIIEEVVRQLGYNLQLSDKVRNTITDKAKSTIFKQHEKNVRKAKEENKEVDEKYESNSIAKNISNIVVDQTVDNKFKDIAKDIISLENRINKAEEKTKNNYRHADKFLKNL